MKVTKDHFNDARFGTHLVAVVYVHKRTKHLKVLPVDTLRWTPSGHFPPFNAKENVVKLFGQWYRNCKFGVGCKIIPVYFGIETFSTMQKVLGEDVTNELFIWDKGVDVESLCNYMNDLCFENFGTTVFIKPSIQVMLTTFEITPIKAINTYAECVNLLNCYNRLRKMEIPAFGI